MKTDKKTILQTNIYLGGYVTNNSLLDKEHPIGSSYIQFPNTKTPAEMWGGTWELTAKDCFLVGAGDSYTIGTTGGEKEHTLTTDEMPKHDHDISFSGGVYAGYKFAVYGGNLRDNTIGLNSYELNKIGATDWLVTSKSGSSVAHNNLPPYVAVNIWVRVE
jgi:hypothetical protein